jgi:hypothetical protein
MSFSFAEDVGGRGQEQGEKHCGRPAGALQEARHYENLKSVSLRFFFDIRYV